MGGDRAAGGLLTGDEFLAIRGFEWSSPRQGHSNVWCSAAYTGYHDTGDQSMQAFYEWLAKAQPVPGAQVLASFNHPGREVVCFDGCTFVPALDERIVALECFNRGDDYGDASFQALDRGWHVGAIGVSDHHRDDWGNPTFPRAGILAPALTLSHLQSSAHGSAGICHALTDAGPARHGRGGADGIALRLGSIRPADGSMSGVMTYERAIAVPGWNSGLMAGKLIATHETRGLQQGKLVYHDSTTGCSGTLVRGARAL